MHVVCVSEHKAPVFLAFCEAVTYQQPVKRGLASAALWQYVNAETSCAADRLKLLITLSLSLCAKSRALTSVRTLKIPSTDSHTIVWTCENTAHTDRNTAHTDRNTAHTDRNTAHADRNTAHTDRNTAHTDRNTAHTDRNVWH